MLTKKTKNGDFCLENGINIYEAIQKLAYYERKEEEINLTKIDYAKSLVYFEVKYYFGLDFFSEEQINLMIETCYENIYKYNMNELYAIRDAVSSVMVKYETQMPESYEDRFWLA